MMLATAPLNNGHIETSHFVHCRDCMVYQKLDCVLYLEIPIVILFIKEAIEEERRKLVQFFTTGAGAKAPPTSLYFQARGRLQVKWQHHHDC